MVCSSPIHDFLSILLSTTEQVLVQMQLEPSNQEGWCVVGRLTTAESLRGSIVVVMHHCCCERMLLSPAVLTAPDGLSRHAVGCRLQERNTMLQAMVDSPEEAEGWDAPQAERPAGTGGSMTTSTLHRILQVR